MSEDTLTETAVAKYLADNPEFLLRHSDLFEKMLPPGRELGSSVADLQRVMVTRLRDKVEELRVSRSELLTNGHANDENLSRIHGAALTLLEAETLSDLATSAAEVLPALLGVDCVAMAIESDEEYSEDGAPGLKRLPSETIEGWMGPAYSMLRANCQPMPLLFGDTAVRSIALLRLELGEGQPAAVLGFGSCDPEWFAPEQETDLAEFLGGVAARCLKRFVAVHAEAA